MTETMESIHEVVALMPKVELHAHLNGSISDHLLLHLRDFAKNYVEISEAYPGLHSRGVLMESSWSTSTHIPGASRKAASLQECWDAFAKIHDVIRTPQILYVATVNVIAEFSQDNVTYLELRTGPKNVHEIPSKISYVEAVLQAIKDSKGQFPTITVKLIISIDRGKGEQSALEIVQLASAMKEKYPDIVAGIDVSGNPQCGHYSWIIPVMEEARRKGLKITCHLPEIMNPEETLAFMKFGPERVGHGVYLHPQYRGTDELWNVTKEKKIPVECCISSNVISGVVESAENHIVRHLHEECLPYVICTDDSGVFQTTLSNEFRKFMSLVPLSMRQVRDLSLQAVDYSFAEENEKAVLKETITCWWKQRLQVDGQGINN